MASQILAGWIVENWSYLLTGAFSLVGTLAVVFYRVRVHHKVLFREHGELNFVTHEQKDEIIKQEWNKQEEKNKVMITALEKSRHEACPLHTASMDLIKEVKTTQQGNIQRMNNFEEAMKKAAEWREKNQETLGEIREKLSTLLERTSNMTESINDLKEQVKA